MNRRNLIKTLTAAAGGALNLLPAAAQQAASAAKPASPFAVPLRALVQKNGILLQPIQVTLQNAQPDTPAIIRLDDVELDRRQLSPGKGTFEVLVPRVKNARQAIISVEHGGQTQTCTVDLKPVRTVLVYILPHSHHDLGYTDLQAPVEERQIENIFRGMRLARATADYPEGARFVWNLEVLWAADLFLQRRSKAEIAEFLDAIKRGWIALNGSYANELTGLCRPEELLELFRFGTKLGRVADVKVDSAMMSDVPGFSWGTVTAMAQAGIRYFSAAPNFFDRIGTFMTTWQDRPFWWVSPSGLEKILMWIPWTGYAMSHVMKKLSPEFVGLYQDRLDEVDFPYDISCIRWSGHGDNAEPDPEISEFVRSWNERYAWPKFHIASTGTAFAAFERQYGRQLPRFQGDLTPYWEDGAGSSARETSLSRSASERLTQAAALAAIRDPADFQHAAYQAAWRQVLLYSEHTWGAYNSVSNSEIPFVTSQWAFKREFAVQADARARALLAPVSPQSASSHLHVFNTGSSASTQIVRVPLAHSKGGDRVEDGEGRPVASQRLAGGELAFLAVDVPPFSAAAYTLLPGTAFRAASPVTASPDTLQNDRIRVRIDSVSGNLIELTYHKEAHNFIGNRDGASANEYLYLTGVDFEHLHRSGAAKITIEDPGPLVATLRIESSAEGSKGLVRRLTLAAGMDHLHIANLVDKQRAPLNPHPGEGDQAGEFAQHGAKESLQFGFPFNVPNGTMRIDIPFAVMQPEFDQLPGSCKNWLPVGRFVDVSAESLGITLVTLDAPLIEVGAISATMLGSQTNPGIWRKHIEPTQTVFSWVMNNHWGTNYRAYQEGPMEFRYALRPHGSFDAAEIARHATELSQPLIVLSAASSSAPPPPLLQVEPAGIAVVALKPSDDGRAWIVRLFGASGENQVARLTWPRSPAQKTWLSNLAEEPLSLVAGDIPVAGWQLVTVRVDHVLRL